MNDKPFPWKSGEAGQKCSEGHAGQERIAISLERYEKLIKTETQFEVAQRLYESATSCFEVDGLLKPIFGEQTRHIKDGAQC